MSFHRCDISTVIFFAPGIYIINRSEKDEKEYQYLYQFIFEKFNEFSRSGI